MKNRIILHNVKKKIPSTKIIHKRPIKKNLKPILRNKFSKNQLINIQNRTLLTRKIIGIGPNINPMPTNNQNNLQKNDPEVNNLINTNTSEIQLKNNEIHSIFNKIITTLNNKMNNSEFTNDEDLLLMTYYNELNELKKEILKIC